MLRRLNGISCSKPHQGLFLKQYGAQMFSLSRGFTTRWVPFFISCFCTHTLSLANINTDHITSKTRRALFLIQRRFWKGHRRKASPHFSNVVMTAANLVSSVVPPFLEMWVRRDKGMLWFLDKINMGSLPSPDVEVKRYDFTLYWSKHVLFWIVF